MQLIDFVYDLIKALIPIVKEGGEHRISKESTLGLFTAVFGILGALGYIDPLAGPEAAEGVVDAIWGAATSLSSLVAIIGGLTLQFSRATGAGKAKDGLRGLFS